MDISRLKSFKGAIEFFGAETISKGLNWLLIFLLFFISAKVPENYGILAVLIAFERMASVIIDFGQKRIVYRFFDKDSENNDVFLSTTLNFWILLTICVVGLFALILFSFNIETFFKIPIGFFFFIFLLKMTIGNVINFITFFYRIDNQTEKYATLILVSNISKFTIAIVASYLLNNVYKGYILGLLLADIITLIYKYRFFSEIHYTIVLKRDILVRNFTYGMPLVLQQLVSNIGPNVDKFFLSQFVSLSDLGKYNFVVTFCAAFTFVYSIGTSFFEPKLFKLRDSVKNFLSTDNTFLSCSLLVASFVIVITYFILKFLDIPMFDIYILIAVGTMLYPLYFYNTYIYMTQDKNYYMVSFSSLAVVVVVVLDYILIQKYGVKGAAYAQISYATTLSCISYLFLYNKMSNFRTPIVKMFCYLFFIIMMFYLIMQSDYVLIVYCVFILVVTIHYIYKNLNEIKANFK